MKKYKRNIVVFDGQLKKVDRKDILSTTVSERRRRIALRIGALGFAGLMFFLVMNGIIGIMQSVAVNRGDSEEGVVVGGQDDFPALNLMLMKLPDNRSELQYCTLLRFDPMQKKIILAPMPAETVIEGKSLREHFADGSEARCAEVVTRLVGGEKFYYSSVNYYNLSKIINNYKGVTIDWKYYVNHNDPDDPKRDSSKSEQWGRSISCSPEKRKFMGGEVIRLFNWPDWPGGDIERADTYTEMWTNFVNEQMTPSRADKLLGYYETIYRITTTEVSQGVFHAVEPGLNLLCEENGNGALAVCRLDVRPEIIDGVLQYSEAQAENLHNLFSE